MVLLCEYFHVCIVCRLGVFCQTTASDLFLFLLEGTDYSAEDKILIGLEDAWDMDTFNWADGKLITYRDPVGSHDIQRRTLLRSEDHERIPDNYKTYYPGSDEDFPIADGELCQLEYTGMFGLVFIFWFVVVKRYI